MHFLGWQAVQKFAQTSLMVAGSSCVVANTFSWLVGIAQGLPLTGAMAVGGTLPGPPFFFSVGHVCQGPTHLVDCPQVAVTRGLDLKH